MKTLYDPNENGSPETRERRETDIRAGGIEGWCPVEEQKSLT